MYSFMLALLVILLENSIMTTIISLIMHNY